MGPRNRRTTNNPEKSRRKRIENVNDRKPQINAKGGQSAGGQRVSFFSCLGFVRGQQSY